MKYKLKELADISSSKRIYYSEYTNKGIPFYRGKEIIEKTENKDISNKLFISKERYDELKIKYGVPQKGDIIMTAVGTLGKCWLVDSTEFYFKDGNCLWFYNFNRKINNKYLYYYMCSNFFQNKIDNICIGSTQKALTIQQLKEVNINLPCIETQNKIVKILDDICHKIRINSQTNDNLYELSSSLYKKWYDSLSSDNITTLSKFDEMGKIVMGQSPKGESYNYYNEGLPLINGAADYENGFLKAQKYTTMPTKTCNKNDLIFCIRATIGLLTICDKEYCLGRGVAGIVNINELYRECVFHLINNSIESFKNLATGSVIVGISRNDIQNIKVKIPSKEQIKNFHNIQKNLFDKMENIRQENIVLTQLRDTLLPKLMNGEIDLDKIEN